MDPERWKRLSPLLDAMLELDAETRARNLASLREEDPTLGRELGDLLSLEDEREDFLAEPLVAPLPGPRVGAAAGPYRLERMLGEGGMGQVWLASRADGLYQRRVALKLLRPGLADTDLQLRFSRERQILAQRREVAGAGRGIELEHRVEQRGESLPALRVHGLRRPPGP